MSSRRAKVVVLIFVALNLALANFGTRRSRERVIIDKILIRQLYQKLNVEELWRINYLLTRSRS